MQFQRGVIVGLDKIREAHSCKLAHDLPHLRLRLSASQVEKGSGESAEDAELSSARCTGARETRVEALLQRGFFACRYAIAVTCLPTTIGRGYYYHHYLLGFSLTVVKFVERLAHSVSAWCKGASLSSTQGDSSSWEVCMLNGERRSFERLKQVSIR